jgi:hypothetical protein
MPRATIRVLVAAIATVALSAPASATLISYVVDRTLPSFGGGTLTVVGTVTVDDAGPAVTAWDITIASPDLGRSVVLNTANSTFFSEDTTLTASATQLSIDIPGAVGFWGPQIRDDSISLRHEWFIAAENDPNEQASLDFAAPDPDSDFANVPRTNPTILLAVPEPATLWTLGGALVAFAAVRRPRRGPSC